MNPNDDSTAPKIVYPCLWVYAVIGTVQEIVHAGILAIVKDRPHTLTFSRRSKEGKYTSFHLEVRVDNEAERNSFYEQLKKIPQVRMVL